MLNTGVRTLIETWQSWPPEILWGILCLTCFATILLFLRLWGAAGLYIYVSLAVVVANVQVLKTVQFGVLDNPIALGTVVFSSIFLATDILNEYYGYPAARRAVWMSFCSFSLWVFLMIETLGFQPLESSGGAIDSHEHMDALFSPAPGLLIAGLSAYLLSQLYDVRIYALLRTATKGKALWFRNNLSTILSSFIDSAVFSILAWIVFAQKPLPWDVVWTTYILGGYMVRIVVALADTPIIYIARYCLPKTDRETLAAKPATQTPQP